MGWSNIAWERERRKGKRREREQEIVREGGAREEKGEDIKGNTVMEHCCISLTSWM